MARPTLEAQFGQRLRRLREQRQMTQTQVAKLMGVTGPQVSHYEHGHQYPTVSRLRKLAKGMGCSTDWLLGLCLLGVLVAAPARAQEDIIKRPEAGVVSVSVRTAPSTQPALPDTASVDIVDLSGGMLLGIGCQEAGPDETVIFTGLSVSNPDNAWYGAAIARAYSTPDCTGDFATSINELRVPFEGAPGAPVLVP